MTLARRLLPGTGPKGPGWLYLFVRGAGGDEACPRKGPKESPATCLQSTGCWPVRVSLLAPGGLIFP
jgi:hypothetical protein